MTDDKMTFEDLVHKGIAMVVGNGSIGLTIANEIIAAHKETTEEANRQQQAEISALHERLEDNHVFDFKGNRVEVKPGSIPDGISCRDETIKLLQEALDANRQAEILQEPVGGICMKDKNGYPLATFNTKDLNVGNMLYTTPPSTDALVALAYQKAAEVIVKNLFIKKPATEDEKVNNNNIKIVKKAILALTPQDAQQALDDRDRQIEVDLLTDILKKTNGVSAARWVFEEINKRILAAKVKGKS